MLGIPALSPGSHAASGPQPTNAAKLPPADCPRVAELAEVVLGQQQGTLRSAMDANEGEGVRVRVLACEGCVNQCYTVGKSRGSIMGRRHSGGL